MKMVRIFIFKLLFTGCEKIMTLKCQYMVVKKRKNTNVY